MAWAAAPTGKRGRPLVYTDAAVQTCLTMKGLFGMALQQTTGFVGKRRPRPIEFSVAFSGFGSWSWADELVGESRTSSL